jgi:hypothetical protein
MILVANLLMVAVAAALIGYPVLAKNRSWETAVASDEVEVNRKELLFSALGEIEFDYQMNKLNDEDYKELKGGYQQEALAVLESEEEALVLEIDNLIKKGRPGSMKKSRGDDESYE